MADVRGQIRFFSTTASRDIAIRFVDAFEGALDRLRDFPRQGAPWPTDNPELQGIRRLLMTTFRIWIFYRETDSHIEIVRVLHGSRDLPALLDNV